MRKIQKRVLQVRNKFNNGEITMAEICTNLWLWNCLLYYFKNIIQTGKSTKLIILSIYLSMMKSMKSITTSVIRNHPDRKPPRPTQHRFGMSILSKHAFSPPAVLQSPQMSSLSRSKSLGALTSLSTDTLPVYITDSARKRCTAIRWPSVLELLTLVLSLSLVSLSLSLPLVAKMYLIVPNFTESQWRWGTARVMRARTGWGCTRWGLRPWGGPSHCMRGCWILTAASKKCIMKNCSSIGQRRANWGRSFMNFAAFSCHIITTANVRPQQL